MGWSWAKWDSSDSCPSLPPPCAMAVSSALTHFSILYCEFICSFLRAFDLPLYSVAELRSAPIWNHLPALSSFQATLGQCCSAAISTCLRAEAGVTALTPRYLCVWSCDKLYSAVPRNTPPCCSPLPYFRLVLWSLSCCLLEAARRCSASQWRGASALLPFCCSS